MSINADLLAKQVDLAYDFMETLHGQALALIKDVETQLGQAPEELRSLQPGGYRFTIKALSYWLGSPQAVIADYYAVYFRQFEEHVGPTPLDGKVPPISFLKVVFRERGLEHPEVRFGFLAEVRKPLGTADKSPKKFEDFHANVASRALVGPPWSGRDIVGQNYQDNHVGFKVYGKGVRLADLPDSEAIAEMVVDPLLKMYREASATEPQA